MAVAAEPEVKPPALSYSDLALLYHGDDFSAGYACPKLIAAICDHISPRDENELLCILYGVPEEDVHVLMAVREQLTFRQEDALARGYDGWRRRNSQAAVLLADGAFPQ